MNLFRCRACEAKDSEIRRLVKERQFLLEVAFDGRAPMGSIARLENSLGVEDDDPEETAMMHDPVDPMKEAYDALKKHADEQKQPMSDFADA